MKLRFAQDKRFTLLELEGKSKSFIASPAGRDTPLYFIQYKMDYNIRLAIDGQEHLFNASGNAETFVHHKDTKSAELE
jgi:hypothetical protein